MYGSLAHVAGGYDKIGFIKNDIHNQLRRQRKEASSDATGAVRYLRDLSLKDPLMYVRHTVGNDRRLQHLFCCDGESQMNYEVFGDVLVSVTLCLS